MTLFKIVIGFRRMLCAQFNPIMLLFLRYSAPLDNSRYTHAKCTSEYWPNLWTRFNVLMWVTISISDYTDYL